MRLLVIPLALSLVACGQGGALYFDEDPPADQLPPSARSAKVVTTPQAMPEALPATEGMAPDAAGGDAARSPAEGTSPATTAPAAPAP